MAGGSERLDIRLRRLALHSGENGFTLDDMARAAKQVEVHSLTVVLDWLSEARRTGLLMEGGFDVLPGGTGLGPRRYRMSAPATSADPGAEVTVTGAASQPRHGQIASPLPKT